MFHAGTKRRSGRAFAEKGSAFVLKYTKSRRSCGPSDASRKSTDACDRDHSISSPSRSRLHTTTKRPFFRLELLQVVRVRISSPNWTSIPVL